MQAIGIDIGSSTVKGAVLDLEHRTIGNVVQVPFPPPISGLPPLHYEVDPNVVVRQVDSVAPASSICADLLDAVLHDSNGRPGTHRRGADAVHQLHLLARPDRV